LSRRSNRNLFKGDRKPRKKLDQTNFRFIFFTTAVMVMFGVLAYGLFNLQIVKGDEYAAETGRLSVKSIPIKGSRGMITDINSVVLAKSEKAYNVTFHRQNEDWDYPTVMLLEAIGIIESHGGALSVTSPLRRSEESQQWEFDFGEGISETSWNTRRSYFYSNNYLSTRLLTAGQCFDRLRQRYGLPIWATANTN